MLVFLTSLRHPLNSRDFGNVEKILERSLRSICSQLDPLFRVVVVSNVVPQIDFHDPRVVYHVVDFPPPSLTKGPVANREARFRDKGAKLLAGALFASQFGPSYFAIVDSDDIVSRRLAGFINTQTATAGWIVDGGYAVNCRTWTVQRKSGLSRYCGSTLIPSAPGLLSMAASTDGINCSSPYNALLSTAGWYFIERVIGSHLHLAQHFRARGETLERLPFRAVGWMQATGENSLMTDGVTSGVPISVDFCREFGLDESIAKSPTSPSLACLARESGNAFLSFVGAARDRFIARAGWGG
jgi:hypothetical protein